MNILNNLIFTNYFLSFKNIISPLQHMKNINRLRRNVGFKIVEVYVKNNDFLYFPEKE